MKDDTDSLVEVGQCPYRLRVTYSNKFANKFAMSRMDARRLRGLCSGSQNSERLIDIDGAMYIGFRDYASILRAFQVCGTFDVYSRRMVDPYAIHVSIPRYLHVNDICTHFARYGELSCVVQHTNGKGLYAFVNFMHRESALFVLRDGPFHIIRGKRCKVRAKVLSTAEPHFPKPYSPARYCVDV